MRLTRGKLADAMPFLLEHHYLRRRTADPRRLKFLLSYADSTVGHRGVVYQALSGIHVSVSKGHTLWKNDATGEVVSNRSMDQRRPENREGFVRVKTGLKYLYVWPLHEKRERSCSPVSRGRPSRTPKRDS